MGNTRLGNIFGKHSVEEKRSALSNLYPIEVCGRDDFPGLLELLAQLWPDKKINTNSVREAYEHAISSNDQIYLCAKSQEKIIAFGSLTIKNNLWQEGNIGHIDELVVDKEYRKQGIGMLLMEQLISRAREHGCRRLELDTAFHRKDAHRFYEKHGFEKRAFVFSKVLNQSPF